MTVLRLAFFIDALVTAWFIHGLAASLKSQHQSGVVPDSSQANQQILLAIWITFDVLLFAGIFWPLPCALVLVVQLLYKLIWLALFALPAWWRGQGQLVSTRLWGTFLLYCVTYPWVIPWETLGIG